MSRVVCGAASPCARLVRACAHATARPDGRRLRLVEARDRQADQQREDHRTEPEVERLRPPGQPGQDLQPADDDLDRVQHRRPPTATRAIVGRSRRVRHATTASTATITPTTAATQRCRTCAEVASVRAGKSVPPINGQSGNTSAESVAVTCEPKSRSAKVARVVKAASSVKRWLRPPPAAEAGRETGTHRQEHEQRDQQQGRGQVRRDRLPAVPEADGLAAEPRLEPDETDRRDGRPQQRRPVAMVTDRQDREAQDLEADDRRDGPVDPLDPRLRVVDRRQQLAVAERPVRAAETGIGGAHDDADDDQQDRGPERQRGELLEAGQRVSWHAGRRCAPERGRWVNGHAHSSAASVGSPRALGAFDRRPPAASATLAAMTPRSRLALVAALVLVVAACGPGPSRPRPRRRPRRRLAGGRCVPDHARARRARPRAGTSARSNRRCSRRSSTPAGSIACGQTRLMFSFLDDQNVPVGEARPDRRGRAVRPRGGSGDTRS